MAGKTPSFEHLVLNRIAPFVVNVQLNRPNQRNALNGLLWHEIGEAFKFLDSDPDTRVIILTGNGRFVFIIKEEKSDDF